MVVTRDVRTACSKQDSKTEREMLPLPSGVLDMFKEDSIPEDEPSKHDGRVRTFSHFPGNWAMHVFIPFKASVHFESLVVSVAECLSAVTSHEVHMIPCDELHMSVSRTVPIRHYWIEPIVQQLRNGLSTMHRSFVALKIMSEYKKFKDVVDLVNEVFQEFSLPAFYKDPSFHVSVAWLLGDICSERTQDIQTKLQEVFDAHVCEKDVARSLVLKLTEVHCKIGNKHFVFPLDAT
ncbi:U6 snRNA phosphodiesterase 1-like isoform X2 [Oculina patagonica]